MGLAGTPEPTSLETRRGDTIPTVRTPASAKPNANPRNDSPRVPCRSPPARDEKQRPLAALSPDPATTLRAGFRWLARPEATLPLRRAFAVAKRPLLAVIGPDREERSPPTDGSEGFTRSGRWRSLGGRPQPPKMRPRSIVSSRPGPIEIRSTGTSTPLSIRSM